MLTKKKFKKLIEITSKLPTADLLEQYKQVHQDLVIQFFVSRNQSQLLGQSLKARFGGGGGNPPQKSLDNGEIDEYECEVIWAMVDCYQSIFTLLQMNWEAIKKYLPKYIGDYLNAVSLVSETNLFFELLREHYDDNFKRCADGWNFTPSQAKHRAEILYRTVEAIDKNKELIPIGAKDRQKAGLSNKHRYFFLFSSVLNICKEEVKKGNQASIYYENIWRTLARLSEVHKCWSSQHRGESRARAVKWDKGKFLIGTKGGYTSVTKLNQSFSDFE